MDLKERRDNLETMHEMFVVMSIQQILVCVSVIALSFVAMLLCSRSMVNAYEQGFRFLCGLEAFLVVANAVNIVFNIVGIVRNRKDMREEKQKYQDCIMAFEMIEELEKKDLKENNHGNDSSESKSEDFV